MSSYDRVSIIKREGPWMEEREYLTMSHRKESESESENEKIKRQSVTDEFLFQ